MITLSRRVVRMVAAIAAAALGGIFATLIWGTHNSVDLTSYGGGWQYTGRRFVVNWTDDQTAAACATYADGFAQLDGFTDSASFLRGCHDALAHDR